MYRHVALSGKGVYHWRMAYPEKKRRNARIYRLHTSGLSYREIAKKVKLKSVKSVFRIVARQKLLV